MPARRFTDLDLNECQIANALIDWGVGVEASGLWEDDGLSGHYPPRGGNVRVADHPEVALNSVCDHPQRRVSIRKAR